MYHLKIKEPQIFMKPYMTLASKVVRRGIFLKKTPPLEPSGLWKSNGDYEKTNVIIRDSEKKGGGVFLGKILTTLLASVIWLTFFSKTKIEASNKIWNLWKFAEKLAYHRNFLAKFWWFGVHKLIHYFTELYWSIQISFCMLLRQKTTNYISICHFMT